MSSSDLLQNIKKLREMTGVGFKDCKAALDETNGDIEKSVEYLRKKGIAKASKKMSRTASEGLALVKEDKGEISLIEINSETDFVAKNENFIKFCKELSDINFSVKGNLDKLNNSKMSDGQLVKDSLVNLMNCILDQKEKPPIMSAILKQRTTELSRDVVNHSMDIVAGSAICMGPQNFVAPAYLSCPIGITVEGSNTMTRSLLIFGQGLIRSHPHMLPIIHSIQNDDYNTFKSRVFKMISENTVLLLKPVVGLNDLDKFVKFFSLSSTLSLVLGGQLKRKEFLSGRYADLLSYIVAGYAMEWHALQNNLSDHVILKSAQSYNLKRIDDCAKELIQNHPHSWFHLLCYRRFIGSKTFVGVSDYEKTEISNQLGTHDSQLRKLFDMNTLSHMHPNIKRINEALSGKNINVDDIMKVDLYTAEDDKLVLKKCV